MSAAEGPGVEHLSAFRRLLPEWFEQHRRELPWREADEQGRRDPYRVWVAEVMLQQTRVDQALPYFERFTDRFPTLDALASADLDEVLLAWEGLGYYRRARHLHGAVREVATRYNGAIPDDERRFGALPGVGSYTSAAVLSLAFGRPLAAVDGNVTRVLSRVFAIEGDVTRAPVRREIASLATALLDPDAPGRFNEAMMELGATLCTPRRPRCGSCPLASVCAARAEGDPERYPIPKKKRPVPHHDIAVAVIRDALGKIAIQQRPAEAMLGGLWEFPGGKVEPGESPSDACVREVREELGIDVVIGAAYEPIRHAYSHFKITLHAFDARAEGAFSSPSVTWVNSDALGTYPFPRANRRLIELLRHAPAAANL